MIEFVAAKVASQWLELLHLDIKGRLAGKLTCKRYYLWWEVEASCQHANAAALSLLQHYSAVRKESKQLFKWNCRC